MDIKQLREIIPLIGPLVELLEPLSSNDRYKIVNAALNILDCDAYKKKEPEEYENQKTI